MQNFVEEFDEQFIIFQQALEDLKQVEITTLGPEGTSSDQAAKYLVKQLYKWSSNCDYNIILLNTFQGVFKYLVENKKGYVLIPNAYENINEFYWNPNFSNVLNFLFSTPKYGLIKKIQNDCMGRQKLKIASCPAVQGIYKYLLQDLLTEKDIEIIKTDSTVETVQYILEDKADIGITNESAFKVCGKNDIEFISDTYNTKIVWSLFEYIKS